MGTAIPSSGEWGCPIVTRQIIRRVIETVGVSKYYGSLQFNIGWQFGSFLTRPLTNVNDLPEMLSSVFREIAENLPLLHM